MTAHLSLLTGPFGDARNFGGVQTHADGFVREFIADVETPLSSVFTNVPDQLDVGVVTHALTGYEARDAQTIRARTEPASTIFFLNSPLWIPTIAHVAAAGPVRRVIVRCGGNDFVGGWTAHGTGHRSVLRALVNRAWRAPGVPGAGLAWRTLLARHRRDWLISLTNQFVDVVIANSEYSHERYRALGIDPARIETVLGGVDTELFHPSAPRPSAALTVLTVARLGDFKGVDLSLRAFAKARSRCDRGLVYRVVGDGPARKTLVELARSLGVADAVTFVGSRAPHEVAEECAAADLFLHLPIQQWRRERELSYIITEAMGRCLCEAAAAGLPAVVSAVGGVTEVVVDDVTAVVVPEGDDEGAAAALVELAHDDDRRARMARAARARAEADLSFERVFAHYRRLFTGAPVGAVRSA